MPPRTNTLLGAGLLVLVLGMVAIAGYLIYSKHRRDVWLNEHGERITGTLGNEFTESRRSGGDVRYKVTYSFLVNGVAYSDSAMLATRPRSRDAVIIYDPANPSNHKLEGDEPFSPTWPVSLAVLIVLCLFSGVSYLVRKNKQRRKFGPGTHYPTSKSGLR